MINKIDKYRYASMPKDKINELFLEACTQGNLEKIEYFLLDEHIQNAEIHYKNYTGLFNAAQYKKNEVVKFFLESKKIKNPSVDVGNGRLINYAFAKHNIDLIDYLLLLDKGKRIDLKNKGEEIFKGLMSNFKENQEMIKLLVVKYNIEKTQNIIDFLAEINRNIEDKKQVNEWFEKRDLKNAMEFYYQPKEDTVKTKRLKI